jgi:formyl-CoA transferase
VAGVLDGVRVVDFTQMMAGPVCPSLLGDMGADVIKIEPPDGDSMRHTGDVRVGGESDLFLSVNRNKRSIVLDLKTADGQRAAQALANHADVIVENFRPGTADRLGIGYETVCEANPDIIYCSITGFGKDSADSSRPALDPVMQALSGVMAVTGDQRTGPLCAGIPVSDFITPVLATLGIVGALFARQRDGHGQRIDISMLNASIFSLMPRESYFLATGKEPERLGNSHFQLVPYNAFKTRDGRSIMVIAHNNKFWQALLDALDCADFVGDPRFATNADRAKHREIVDTRFRERFATADLETWIEKLTTADAIFAPIRSLAEVLTDDRVRDEMLAELPHPTAERVSVLRNPIHYSQNPMTIRHAPPTLGEHTSRVLTQLARTGHWPDDSGPDDSGPDDSGA